MKKGAPPERRAMSWSVRKGEEGAKKGRYLAERKEVNQRKRSPDPKINPFPSESDSPVERSRPESDKG